MELNELLFSEGPESLDAVIVDLPLFEFVSVIDIQVFIPTEQENIVSSPGMTPTPSCHNL
jgi:hypothetical protein